MADLQIRVSAMLDVNSSKTKIQNQLDEIAKGLKLTVGIDPKQLSEFNNQLKQIQQQFKQTSNTKIVSDQDVNKIKEVYTSIEKAVEKYSQLGTVKISQNIDPITKELQSFQLQVTKANGEVDKLKFALASLKGIQGVNGFVMTGQSSTNNTQAITERQLQQEQQINRAIEQRNQTLANQLQLYQRTAEIQVSALKNNPNKMLSGDQQQALTTYLNNVRALNVQTPQLQERMRQLGLDFREVSTQAYNAHNHTLTFGQALQTAMEKFPIWMVASTAFFQTFNFFKNGIEYVNELNQALTQISIVTYQNQQQVTALGESYNKLAQTMGVTTMDIANEAAELYRQGLTTDQVTERMKIITQYAKISSIDTKTATEIMTAAINSMGVSAQRASDVWAFLGDATATGADEIGKAMQKVGGTAGSLKVPFEEVSSWIAVISSRTRESAETVGQGVKSILARVQSLKENGFDETDGTKVNQVAKALNTVGIKLVDAQGQFRNFGTVMNELGSKWQDLDSRTKAYLATTVAGTYQQSRFLNLMEGYGDVTKLYSQAMDSAGTTQKKFDLYLQGTEAQLNQLKDTWQAVWMDAFNSKDLQNIIGLLNNVGKGFQFVVNHAGILPTTIGAVTTALLLLNTTTRTSILNFGLLSTSLVRTGDSLPIVTGNARIAQSALYNLTLAGRAAGAGFGFLGTMAKGVFSFIATTALPVAAIMAVSFAIEKVTQAISDANQKQQEAKQKQDDLVKSYSSSTNQIDKLASKYIDISNQVADGKISKSNQDYLDTMNQLGKLMPNLVVSEDEHGNKILASADAVKKELDYVKQLKEIQDKTTITNFEKDLDSQASKVEIIIKNIDKYKENAKALASSPMVASGKSKYFDEGSVLDAQRQQVAQERELQLALQNSKSYIQDKAKAFMDIDGSTQRLSSSQQKLITSYIDESIASKKSIKDGNDFKQFLSDTTNNAADLAKKLAELPDDLNGAFSAKDIKGFSNDQIEYLRSIGLIVRDGGTDWDNYSTALKSVFKDADTVNKIIDTLKNSTKQNSDATDEATYSVDVLDKALKTAKGDYNAVKDVINQMIQSKQYDMAVTASQNEAYSALSDTLSPVNKMLEDMANGQTLTASSAMDLIKKVPEMTKYLSIQNGQVQVNIQGVIDWRDAQISSFQDMINAEKVQIDAQSKALKTKLANYGVEIQAILSVAQANQALADAEKKHAENAAKINGSNAPGAMHASMVEQGQYDEVASGINKIKDAYSSLDQLSSMASTGLNQVGTSLEKNNSTTQQSIYVTDKYKQSMDALNESLKKLQSETNNYARGTTEYENALQRQINLLKQQKDLTDAQASSLKQQIDSGVIQQTGMITNSNSNGSVSSSSSSSSNYNGNWNSLVNKNLNQQTQVTAAQLNQWINGHASNNSVMYNQGQSFLNAANASGLDPLYLVAHAALETGWGSSSISKNKNNFFGIGAFDSSPYASAYGFNGVEAGIVEGAKWIAKNFVDGKYGQNTLQKMRFNNGVHQYATDQGWADKIAYIMGSSGLAGNAISTSSGSNGTTGKTAANMQQDIDQAKSQLLQLQDTSQGFVDQMQALKVQIIQDRAVMYDNIKKTYEAQLTQFDYLQSVQNKNSADWLHTQMRREEAYNTEIDLQKQSIDYLQQQIQYNNDLTDAQKQTLSDDVMNRQKELLSLEQKLYDTRNQMATEIVDTYKQALTDMKDAATKSIDNMINDINKQADQASYKKKLTDAQKSAQDIQNQITQLMLDDSTAAKKKISDLQKQLTTQNDSIDQMVTDNDKQQRIDNLNIKKQNISDYYDNMLNDEHKFAQIRSSILNLNNQSVINDLNSFSKTIQSNVNILGTSVVNTIIDMINRANGYMGLSTANSSVIGHIASLDSGGLLPSWGSGGKMLLAHEKEMVLNKADTSNVLKIVNVARDFFSNIVKLPDLSGMKTAISGGGNNYYVNFNVDKMTGNQNDVNTFVSKFVNGIKSKGGNI